MCVPEIEYIFQREKNVFARERERETVSSGDRGVFQRKNMSSRKRMCLGQPILEIDGFLITV